MFVQTSQQRVALKAPCRGCEMCTADVGRRPAACYVLLLPVMLEMVPIRRNLMGQHEAEDALLGFFGLLQKGTGAQCWSGAEGSPLPIAKCYIGDRNCY